MKGPIISLTDVGLRLGDRTLWEHLNLVMQQGEFVAILGPNGSGKTSLLRVLLGLQEAEGEVAILGEPPRRGNRRIGYIPQQKGFDENLPIRGRDLVRFGINGHRFGFGGRLVRKVDAAIDAVGASEFADRPVGRLSGGQQQRLRVAQALVGEPHLLLCDEPLLSLDVTQQQAVSALIDKQRTTRHMAVLFVTHDINPIMPYVDRVLYLANGRWASGTPDEVLTTETLSSVYGARVDVLRLRGRVIVMGAGESLHTEPDAHHHHHHGGHHG